jgi:hypothetical protein
MRASGQVSFPANARLFEKRVRELGKCEFAGEVALTAEELCELAHVVQRELNSRVPAPGAYERLVLAAVNCAYFYMDAEGFWRPFCKLLKMEFSEANTSKIGGRIEEALLHLGLIEQPGYGAFRYVTPVRMQAGLTRYDIPIFAQLLEAARQDFGWAALQALPDDELTVFLEANHPAETKFISFLKDPRSGMRLLHDVVRHLVLWRNGLIDESGLNSLHGYRPGFWSELLSRLGNAARTGRAAMPATRTPIFFFDENRAECGLLFSRELASRRTYRLDGEIVRESFNPLRRIEEFREEFRVEAEDGVIIRVQAWKPIEDAPFALFKQSGEYLAHNSAVVVGAYLLLAFQRSTLPEGLVPISDFEFCATPGLRFWHVEVNSSTDLAALGYKRSGLQSPIRLDWVERSTLVDGFSDASDVFLGHLPAVRVSPTRIFLENRAALCWSAGRKTGRVQVSSDGEDAIVDLPLSAPCRGEVWVEPLGRERAQNALAAVRLSFCVLPKCMIVWPDDLYSEDDEPLVEFRAFASGVECEFPDCKRVGNPDAIWTVPAGASWIEGQLEAGDVAVRLVKRIRRAAAENADGGELWLEGSALACDESVRIRGLPETPVHLELDSQATRIDIPLQQAFNEHGVAHVRCWDFHDRILADASPVYQIRVHGRNRSIPTRGRIVDLSNMEKQLLDNAGHPEPAWFGLLGNEGSNILRIVAQSLVDPQHAVWPDSFGQQLPDFFAKWARSLFACACVLSPNRPAARHWQPVLDAVPTDCAKTLHWVLRTEAALAKGGDLAGASDEFAQLTWEPPRAAWRTFLAELYARVRAEHDLVPLIEEWADEIGRSALMGAPAQWNAVLARMPGGEHLSKAYLQNLRSEVHQECPTSYCAALQRAYTSLSRIESSNPPLVQCLARLLKELLLVKSGGTNDVTEALPINCHRLLRPLLTVLIKNQGGAIQQEDCDATSVLGPDLLPLPEGDRERLRSLLQASNGMIFTQ